MIIAKKRRVASHWKVIINSGLLLISVILLVSINQMFRGLKASQERLGYVSKAEAGALDQKRDLTGEYRDLTTVDGVEYYVRNHYRAISEGEELVVVVDPKDVVSAPTAPEITWQEKLRIWLRIP